MKLSLHINNTIKTIFLFLLVTKPQLVHAAWKVKTFICYDDGNSMHKIYLYPFNVVRPQSR